MGCTLEELDDTTCRFPIGEPGEADFHFCGAVPAGDSPYCRNHTRLAYQFRRRAPLPPLSGYVCAPCGDGWILVLPLQSQGRCRPRVVDVGVNDSAEIFARHRRARARLFPCRPARTVTLPVVRHVADTAELTPDVIAPALAPVDIGAAQGAVPVDRPPRRIREIMQAVAVFYQVAASDLASSRRTTGLVQPRHVAWFLCRRLTADSFAAIGRHFGGRHHATVLLGVRGIARRMNADAQLAREIAAIEAMLRPTDGAPQPAPDHAFHAPEDAV